MSDAYNNYKTTSTGRDRENPLVSWSTLSSEQGQETGAVTLEDVHPDAGPTHSKKPTLFVPSRQAADSFDNSQWQENQGAEYGNAAPPLLDNRQLEQAASSATCQHQWSRHDIECAASQPTTTLHQNYTLSNCNQATNVQKFSDTTGQTPIIHDFSSSLYDDYEIDGISSTPNTRTTQNESPAPQSTMNFGGLSIGGHKHSTSKIPHYVTNSNSINPPKRSHHEPSTQRNPANMRFFKDAFEDLGKSTSENQRRPIPPQGPPKRPLVDNFAQWMRSRSPEQSLWCSDMHRKSLLAYIGKIYDEHREQMYSRFDHITASRETLDDLDVLHEVIQQTKRQRDAQRSLDRWEDSSRINRRVKDLQFIFEFDRNFRSRNTPFTVTPPHSQQIIDPQSIQSYFDFGCGDGTITASIGAYLGLTKENIFGGDVFGGQNTQITFVTLNEDQSSIGLPDDHVDLITSFVTFHHVSQIQKTLTELARILRLRGYLILREHDCNNERSFSVKYLHFVHAIMMIARVGEFAGTANNYNDNSDYLPIEDDQNNPVDWSRQKSRIIEYTRTIHYRTGCEWQKKLENVGFHLRATLSYGTNEASNPQKLFYAVYQLVTKQ